MSFILEALKKSEQQRQQQNASATEGAQADPLSAGKPFGRRLFPWLLAGLLPLLMLGGWWFYSQTDAPRMRPPVVEPSTTTPAPASQPAAPEPAEATPAALEPDSAAPAAARPCRNSLSWKSNRRPCPGPSVRHRRLPPTRLRQEVPAAAPTPRRTEVLAPRKPGRRSRCHRAAGAANRQRKGA